VKAGALVAAGAGALGLLALHRQAGAARAPSRAMLAFGRPVPATVRAIVSSGWARPRGDRMHRALDIPLAVGTPVLAIDDGIVVRVRHDDRGDAGRWVGVLHPSGVTSRSLHLARVLARPGARVRRGELLGLSGDSGNSAAPHLHLDLRAPSYLLPWIARWTGTPRGGWGPALEPHGRSIPGEPWIPVDGYRDGVQRDAAAAGVPLHGEVRRGR
jgi:murein DD-endopeptidase MepM/ murein hydrolase activator NlpD